MAGWNPSTVCLDIYSFPNGFWVATGAPLGGGGASPLRVATGGAANRSSEARRRRSPAPAQRRREDAGSVQKIAGHPWVE